MSEKIYGWLLRLYPAHFRNTYGEDALQLFRDRCRQEKGFRAGLRLWFDLLADAAISIPREHRRAQPAIAVDSALPSFQVLEDEWPRPGALLSAVLLSMAAFGAFSALLGHGGGPAVLPAWSLGLLRQAAPSAIVHSAKLDAAERRRVIEGAIANLKKYYNFPDVAEKMADALLSHEKSGDDDGATDPQAFADLLTSQMTDVSDDRQLKVIYYPVRPPDPPRGPTPGGLARYREVLKENNCFFEKVQTLPHNIGYLKLNAFPDPTLCQPTAARAMATLNHADAIIFDLRENHGGYPSMVALLAGYLLNQRTHLNDIYNRAENSTRENWTPPPVPGNRLADKPAYVLTSGETFSGAEEFSYDLKMLKRATLVGEPTSGRGHIPRGRRIDDHFEIRVPDERAINPISKINWDGPGVQPDVKVDAADALQTALKLATSSLRKSR